MAGKYPFVPQDRLYAAQLDFGMESTPGTSPADRTGVHHTQLGKLWLDTSVSPNQLRVCTAAQANPVYNAGEWFSLGAMVGGQSLSNYYLPLSGNNTINGNLTVNGNVSATNGTFSAALSAGSGTFTGSVTGGTLSGSSGNISNNFNVGGTLTCPTIMASGSGNLVGFTDRTTGVEWWWYANNGIASLYSQTGNKFSVDLSGNVYDISSLTVGQSITVDGNYIYLAGGTGAINATGGPFLYSDASNTIIHLGSGNNSFILENYGGSQIATINSSGSLSLAGNATTAGSVTATGAIFPNGGINNINGISGFTIGSSGGNPIVAFAPGNYIEFIPGTGFSYTTGGNHHFGGSLLLDNVLTVNADIYGNVYRRSEGGGVGARIGSFGGDWDYISFAATSGGGPAGLNFIITPNDGTTSFVIYADTSSDARLKTDIRNTEIDALAAILATPVRAFEWNELGRQRMPDIEPTVPIGLVAQELEQTMPFAVAMISMPGHDGMRHIVDHHVVPYLVRAIQQLKDEIEELKGRLH
jgi:hypothetical protein